MNNYKELCAELLAALKIQLDEMASTNRLCKKAEAALAEQQAEGPTDEDLYDLAEVFNGDPVPAMRRALELWGRPAVEPVPVSERLPGPEDCDSEGRCWWFSQECCWWYQEPCNRAPNETDWLPYHALPLPTK